MDGIGSRPLACAPRTPTSASWSVRVAARRKPATCRPRHFSTAGAWLRETQNLEPTAVGHRVVHGGPHYDRPGRGGCRRAARSRALCVARALAASLTIWPPFALCSPGFRNGTAGRLLRYRAFHRGRDGVADHYAYPPSTSTTKASRRYGFHGLSLRVLASPSACASGAGRGAGQGHCRSSRQQRGRCARWPKARERQKHDGLHRP